MGCRGKKNRADCKIGCAATHEATKIPRPLIRDSTKILRAVANTQFNRWALISNNIQYDSVGRLLGWQFRFRWIVTPGNDIYFVSVSNWPDTGDGLTAFDRSASKKLIYT